MSGTKDRYEVVAYSEGTCCVVDHDQETKYTLPRVQYHKSVGWNTFGLTREEADALAQRMNQEHRNGTAEKAME